MCLRHRLFKFGFTASFLIGIVLLILIVKASPIPEIEQSIEDVLVARMPSEDFSEKRVFGYSQNGREIKGYGIGNGESCMLFFAGMHGNERGAKDLMDKFAKELAKNPELVNPSNRLVIIPLVNPDGFYEREDKLNANGVNLNRNFDTSFWTTHSSADETTYAGPEPFSEAESRVIKNVVEECDPVMMIAFHSQGHLVSPEVGIASQELAKWYAEKTDYHYFDEWDFYGTATRWFTETTGNPVITVELTNHLKSDWEINKEVLFDIVSGEYEL